MAGRLEIAQERAIQCLSCGLGAFELALPGARDARILDREELRPERRVLRRILQRAPGLLSAEALCRSNEWPARRNPASARCVVVDHARGGPRVRHPPSVHRATLYLSWRVGLGRLAARAPEGATHSTSRAVMDPFPGLDRRVRPAPATCRFRGNGSHGFS